jgi:hypothetical protein
MFSARRCVAHQSVRSDEDSDIRDPVPVRTRLASVQIPKNVLEPAPFQTVYSVIPPSPHPDFAGRFFIQNGQGGSLSAIW